MKRPHRNKTNPCARILGELAKTCFLIGEETDFDAFFHWSAHVNSLSIQVMPANASRDHAVLEFEEYLNIPNSSAWGDDFRTDTYPRVKRFAEELKAFHAMHSE